MNRLLTQARTFAITSALLLPAFEAAAQDAKPLAQPAKAAPAAPTTAPAAPAPAATPPAAPAPAPTQAQDESEPNDAPPQVAQIASPFAAPPPAGNGDPGDATPDKDLSDAIPGDPWGDAQGLSAIALRAIFQLRYTSSFAEDSTNSRASYRVREESLAQEGDGYAINRLFMRLSSDPVKYVGFKAVLDFAELIANDPEDLVKQAYATVRPIPGRLELVVGLFKVPFSILELDPSSRFEFARFGSANELVNDLGFAGRDYGIQVIGAPLPKAKRLQLMLGIFRGHAHDEHDSPAGSIAARVEAKPNKMLRFGGGVISHLRAVTYNRPFNDSDKDVLPNPPDPLYPAQRRWGRGSAYGLDARFKKKGFMFRAEGIYGDRVDIDRRYDAKHFWSALGIAAYSISLGGDIKLLPAFRLEYFDADAGHGKGLVRTISGSVTMIAWTRVRFLVDVTHNEIERNTIVINQPRPLQADPYLALSNFRLTCQLQLEL